MTLHAAPEPIDAPQPKRKARLGIWLTFVLLLLAIPTGLFVWLKAGMPGGAGLAVSALNGRQIGPYGQLGLFGVATTPQGASIDRLTLSDPKGVWLQVQNLTIDWTPEALLTRRLEVNSVRADQTLILRQPVLGPSKAGGTLPVDVQLKSIETNFQIRAGAFAGLPALSHQSRGSFNLSRNKSYDVDLLSTSRSGPRETINLRAKARPAQPASLSLNASGGADSFVTGVLGGANAQSTNLAVTLSGDVRSGSARGEVTSDTTTIGALNAAWNTRSGTIDAYVVPIATSRLHDQLSRFGDRIALSARADGLTGTRRTIDAKLTSPALVSLAKGPVDFEKLALLTGFQLDIQRADLARLSRNQVLGVGSGQFAVEGSVRTLVGKSKGRLTLAQPSGFGMSFRRFDIPIEIEGTPSRLSISATGEGQLTQSFDPRLTKLGQAPKLSVEAQLDRASAMWRVDRFDLVSSGLDARFKGALSAQTKALQGRARFRDLSTLNDAINGQGQIDLNLAQSQDQPWQGKVTLQARNLKSGNTAIDQILGGRLDGQVVPDQSVTGNSRFNWQARTGASLAQGRIDLAGRVPLQGTWSLLRPISVSNVSIAGSGRSGPRGELAYGPAGFAVSTANSRVSIGGWNVENARFLAVGGTNNRPIQAALQGIAPLGPVSLSGSISTRDGVTSFTSITARHAGLAATGRARSARGGLDGAFDLEVARGAILTSGSTSGKLGIAARGGQVGVFANMALSQSQFAGLPFKVSRGTFRAAGLLGNLGLNFAGVVEANNQIGELALSGNADLEGRETSLTLNGGGTIAGRPFRLVGPLRAQPLGLNASIVGQAIWGDYRFGVDGKVRDSGLDVTYVDVTGPNVSARLNGRFGGRGSALKGRAQLSDLSSFNAQLRGSAQGDLSLTNAGGRGWSASVTGYARNLSVGSSGLDTLLGTRPRFELVANAISGRPLTGSWRLIGQQLSGTGTVLPARRSGLFDTRGVWAIRGPIQLDDLEIAGDVDGGIVLQNGALGISARSASLTLGGQSFTQVNATARVASILSLDQIPIEAQGVGSLGPLKISTIVNPKPTLSLRPLTIEYGGIVGRGEAALTNAGPAGTLALSGNPGQVLTAGSARGNVRFFPAAGDTRVSGRLVFTNAAYANAGVSALNGTVSLDGPLGDLGANLAADFKLRDQPASARLALRTNQINTATNIIISGGGTYQNAPWRLTEPLLLTRDADNFKGSGQAVWRQANVKFQSELRGRSLSVLAELSEAPAALFNSPTLRLDGQISGTLALTGINGTLTGEARLDARSIRPVNAPRGEAVDGMLIARLGNGRLNLQGSATTPRGLRARGDAAIPIRTSFDPFAIEVLRNNPLSGDYEIKGPVEAIAKLAFSPATTASGTINAQGQLSGTLATPIIEGRAELIDAALRDPNLGIRVTGANARVNFLGPVADIETMSASDGRGGTIRLSGRIALRDGADWRLAGQMDRFQLIDTSQALIVATGPWALASTAGQAGLSGDLVLNNARFGIPAGNNRSQSLRVREINRPTTLPPVATPLQPQTATNTASTPARGNGLKLDLKVISAGNARVMSRGFDGNFDVDMAVTGTLQRPEVSGRANLVTGRFDLAGRSFDVTRGNVRFTSPLETSRIDFVAQRDTSDIVAQAKIQGSLGRPSFTLESTPAAPQDEILSRILFGRNVAALSVPQAAQLALGISSLATGNQLDPTVRLAQALGLERFSLGTETGGIAGFTAGLRLVRDVYVEVTTGGEDGTITMIEWRPRRRLQIQVTTSQKPESAVSIRVRSKD